ncbi:vWA domain-containing protein [Arthrospira platensis]|nr:VWA domain-containing protein [Arthrospira platensis]AMW31082.1 tellurium resistance protein [Arthrospira platensis YZ]KDR58587.1 tellurium resistance protein [Arthrospira platensis str. Paraca]MBD2671580.1 VWA domain-containing protein [Arthrospira platensis FACHB-439]MBD2713123.1 VWA domain-containing protein [Arthrospira platensis FACHB-835]MDF2208483.1 VWA domain-containing protein [Arthrospira platensis NCB002]MDT9185148.1 VWA domain-containing protein [Limnospira sp. PMC 289.06]MDT9
MPTRPGGEIASRPLHFIFLCDCSGSMTVDGKIQSLNAAIRESIPHMQAAASSNPNAQVLVRVINFSNGAQWHIASPTKIEEFKWKDLEANVNALTDMGKALSMLSEQMKVPPMEERALPPVLVLISDGQPTDDFKAGLNDIMKQPWGKKSVRIAIAIGKDADEEVLQKFIGHSELRPLKANNPEALVERIKWVSTVVLQSASSPPSQISSSSHTPVTVPIPSVVPASTPSVDDVW